MIGFYCTIIRGRRVGYLAGPFDSLTEAEGRVDDARREACRVDPWCDFDTFGVTRREGATLPPGRLNAALGL